MFKGGGRAFIPSWQAFIERAPAPAGAALGVGSALYILAQAGAQAVDANP